MSNELGLRHESTNRTIYAVLRNAAGQVWETAGAAFETQVVADWADYAIAATETPTGGYLYLADMPAADAGGYAVEWYEQIGASAAIDDPLLATDRIVWDGAAECDPLVAEIAARILTGKTAYAAATGALTVYGDDGTTVLSTVTITGQGAKTRS